MISTQCLRLHRRGRTCAFKDFCSVVLACLNKGSLYTYTHISMNVCSFLWGTISCAVPISGTMACLWVVLEAQQSAQSLQELKLKIIPANQSTGATSQAFRGNQNHFENDDLWGDEVMCRLTWIYQWLARNSSHLKGLLAKVYANDLPCS